MAYSQVGEVPLNPRTRNVLHGRTFRLLILALVVGYFAFMALAWGPLYRFPGATIKGTRLEAYLTPRFDVNRLPPLDVGGGLVQDDVTYAYAGWHYIHGARPDTINPEHPPLGKYLIGLSEVVFGNQNLIVFILSLATIAVAYLISRRLFGTGLMSVIPVYLLATEKIFADYSTISRLEIFVAFFAALALYSLIGREESPRGMALFMILSGLAVSAKWTGVFLPVGLLAYLLLVRNRAGLRNFFLSFPLMPLVYTSSYAVFFLAGGSLWEFMLLQREILAAHLGSKVVSGAPLFLLAMLTGVDGTSGIYTIFDSQGSAVASYQGLSMDGNFNPFTWSLFPLSIIWAVWFWRKRSLGRPMLFSLIYLSFLLILSFTSSYTFYVIPYLIPGHIAITYLLSAILNGTRIRRPHSAVLIYLLLVLSASQVSIGFVSLERLT